MESKLRNLVSHGILGSEAPALAMVEPALAGNALV
jgi:hypothetical protein